MNRIAQRIVLPAVLLVAAYLSFNHDFFRVMGEGLFLRHDYGSEQLVLDGVLHARSGDARFAGLGTYARDSSLTPPSELYAAGDTTGEFKPYPSQFGLQARLFGFLARHVRADYAFYQGFASLCMSLVLLLLFLSIRREISPRAALAVWVVLALSPWSVHLARNIYWLQATWFLPAALAFALGSRAYKNASAAGLLYGLLFAAFLLKFLCGYEYITTITLAACAPLLYLGVRDAAGFRRIALQVAGCGLVAVIAFFAAVGIHARALDPDWRNGLKTVLLTAEKRVASAHPEQVARQVCLDADDRQSCENEFIESLTVSRFVVVARYLGPPHFLPWIDRLGYHPETKPEIKAAVKAFRDSPSVGAAGTLASDLGGKAWSFILFTAASVAAFWIFSAMTVRAALRAEKENVALLAVSVLAPLSWFVLAKGHSYNHYHLNYVLWYLLYVPVGAVLIIGKNSSIKPGKLP